MNYASTMPMELNKIYCMDAIEFMKKIEDKSIDMILCDLPYGTTACKWDIIIPLGKLWEQYERISKEKGIILLFCDEPFTSKLICSNLKMFKQRIVWDKDRKSGFLNANKMLMKQTEDICLFWKKLPTYNPQMVESKKSSRDRYSSKLSKGLKLRVYGKLNKHKRGEKFNGDLSFPSNIIKISANSAECNTNSRLHPTQKPVKLFEYLIKTYTNKGDLVMDCVVGSGTTAVACLNTNRKFLCNDISEEYVKVANDRIKPLLEQRKLEVA